MNKAIEFRIEQGNIGLYEADVIALKFAQAFYGADDIVSTILNEEDGISYSQMKPKLGEFALIESRNSITAPFALFVGVQSLWEFGYNEIKDFSINVLQILLQETPHVKHLAMTIHGPGYGLDEVEALIAQLTGCIQAIGEGVLLPMLESITIVELNPERVNRLRKGVEKQFSTLDSFRKDDNHWAFLIDVPQKMDFTTRGFRSVSTDTLETKLPVKPHVFVAMPFRKDMEDIFYYGIQSAAHENGFLCERIDQEAFTGDILERLKKKIETATVVIAELTGANPNVYLEVGYAWGKGIPTILLVKESSEVCFDVRSQRHLKYEIIKELEISLTNELKQLFGNKNY